MIPFRVKSLSPPCSPSSGYSYMYHAVDGRAPIVVDAPTSDFSNDELAFCSVVDIPWNGRSSKSRGIGEL